jgi:serine-threonine kinase receptor-associated protein
LTDISFVEDGEDKTILVSSAHDKTPQIRNGETGDWIGSFHGHKGAVWSAKVDPLTRTLAATASGDFSSKLWCVNTGKELHEFKHKHVVKSVDFSSDTLKIATGCQDGLLRVFDTCQPESPPQELKIISSITDGIMKVTWAPNEKDILLVCKKNGSIEKWDLRVNNNSESEGETGQQPVQSVNLGTNVSVMDMEVTSKRNIILTASGTKVSSFLFIFSHSSLVLSVSQ